MLTQISGILHKILLHRLHLITC